MKAFLEDIFTRTSIKPADRTRVGDREVYIADGFVHNDDLGIIQRHFGSVIEAGQKGRDAWPNGCYATIWMTPGRIATHGGISLTINPDRGFRLAKIKEAANEELSKKLN